MKTLIFYAILFLLSAAPASAQLGKLNGVAVIVNDKVITIKDIFNLIKDDLAFIERRHHPSSPEYQKQIQDLQRDAVQTLVDRRLILEEFKTAGYTLPETWIQRRIKEDLEQYGDRLTLTKTLQGEGITYESYRQKVRERIIIEAMTQQNIAQEILISPYRIEQFYEENLEKFKVDDEVLLRMIVFPEAPDDPSYSPRKMAEECLLKVREGVPFEEMARVYSPTSRREEGGSLGWVSESMLREELSEIAFSLPPGQVSDVIETPVACYLMLVEDARRAHVKPLSEVREGIEAELKDAERKRLREKWIGRLRDKAFIRYF